MHIHVHLSDASAVADAADLMARFGGAAAGHAAARADEYRTRGNVVHFCRWRSIERLIATLSLGPEEDALLH